MKEQKLNIYVHIDKVIVYGVQIPTPCVLTKQILAHCMVFAALEHLAEVLK